MTATFTPTATQTNTPAATATGTPTISPTFSRTPDSGQVYDAWADTNGTISSITGSASTIYIGGTFTIVGGFTRNRIAAIQMAGGTVDPGWSVTVDNGNVLGLTIYNNVLYAVGSFTSVNGGTVRNRAAAFDMTTGALTAWDPNLNGNGQSIEVMGSTIYVVGAFTQVNGGTARNHAAAFNDTTGAVTGWNPDLDQPASVIRRQGGSLFVGGLFNTVNGGTVRNFVASFDGAAGTANAWNPNPNGQVLGIWPRASSVMLGGQFTSIGGLGRGHAAEVNATTGAVGGWNPNFNAAVRDIREANGATYVVGDFTNVNGGSYTLTYLSVVNTVSGLAYAWAPYSDAFLTVLYQYNPILVGGGMTNIAGSTKVGIAAIVEANLVAVATPNATATYTPVLTPTMTPSATPSASPSPTRTPAPAFLTGVVAGNGGGTYVFTGTGAPGDTVFVTVNGGNVGGSAVVQPDGTWSLNAGTTVAPGDNVAAHSGSPTGPSAGTQIAGPASPSTVTLGAGSIAGGATVLTFNGTAGQQVTVIDAGTGQVLGSGTVPANGPAGVTLNNPASSGSTLQLVVNGMAGPTLPVGPAGSPPLIRDGTVLVEGSTLTGSGIPGATIQAVDDQGRVLGETSVAPDGSWSLPVSGAVEGVGVKVVQDGVAVRLDQPALKLGAAEAFLSRNVFKPTQGGSLDIGFKAKSDERVRVRVFNVAGESVRLIAEMDVKQGVLYGLKWNGQNDFGETVASGLYVVSINGPNTKVLRKVVVLK